MQTLKYINLALAFFLELCMLAAIAWWGYRQGTTPVSKYAIALTLVLLVSVLWGLLAAPKAKKRLPFVPRLLFELALFLAAAFLLYQSGETAMATAFAITACCSIALAFIWKQ